MDVMDPWEVASGCDVVLIGRKWPDLVMTGGIDKRVLAQDKHAINKHLEYIIPAMRDRGGYILAAAHAIQRDVPLDNVLALLDAAREG